MSRLSTISLFFDAAAFLAVVLLLIFYFKKATKLKELMMRMDIAKQEEKNKEKNEQITTEDGEEKGKLIFMDGIEGGLELGDLLKASAEGLGNGNFGNCYKAMLDDRPAMVVKRLKDVKPLTSEEFANQLLFIAGLKHPNLLPVLAYYYSKDEKLVVYKYAQKGNLFSRIHGRRRVKDRIPFRWNARLSVARGVARALEYLHLNSNSQTTLPHGNLKSTNVLLDDHDVVLVSDYGLSSLVSLPIASQRMVSYKSPEYQNARRVSKKSDVWSYGCLLLELLTGRIPSHSAPSGTNGVELCSWVHQAVREEWTAEIFDLEISAQRGAAHGMVKLLELAIQCCDKSPEKRPEMTQVVREVENIRDVESSEDEDDLSSDPSLTDDSMTSAASVINGHR
ncbi:hypothetical protein L1049_025243 [Liquidambar formosana]|uniref:Protein kinase domain-containing protein n=1 Tax=Liquidambar formosana TaxID=63359 RepID=A0AAP0N2C5_LIQFO